MMFVDHSFFDDNNTKRLGFGMGGALLAHTLVLVWFSLPTSQKTISADTFSPPTSVSVRFITPVEEQPKSVLKVTKSKPIKKKLVVQKIAKAIPFKPEPEVLNNIESATAPPKNYQPTLQTDQKYPVEVLTPVKNIIPVVSEASIKGQRTQPEYPKRSLRMRQEGVVWLHVLISETGARQNIKLYRPSQYALLNQAAIKAVKKWTFEPNIVNGRAVQSWVEIPIEFKIQ